MGMVNAIKSEVKRDKNGRLLPGHGLKSPGRPETKTLKEYVRQKLAKMSDYERDIFLKKIAPDLQWKMAEGNPETKGEIMLREQLPLEDAVQDNSLQKD